MKPLSALVIDDSASDRELLRRSLTGAGYAVAEASDGRSGMATLLESPPDVVVVDGRMGSSERIRARSAAGARFWTTPLPPSHSRPRSTIGPRRR